jgi:hypothetical protein
MEISPNQKALLQVVDTDIENSFSDGVTQSGDYLPALPLYDRIPAPSRVLGRQGILSTFASLLAGLASFTPTRTLLALQNNFGSWNTYVGAFGNPEVYTEAGQYINAIGEVVLGGVIACPEALGNVVFATLPVGARPTKTIILNALLDDDTAVSLFIDAAGQMYLGAATASGQRLSIDELRFRPA